VPQHVWMRLEPELRVHTGALDHPREPRRRKR
jgi:hypothetical protein